MRKLISVITIIFLSSMIGLGQQSIQGNWYGNIQSPRGDIQIFLNITAAPISGTLSSSAGLKALPIANLSFEHDTLRFELPSFNVHYIGKIENQNVKGIWQEGGIQVRLDFSRTPKTSPSTPSTPIESEAYTTEEVVFSQGNGQPIIAGSLTIPKGQGPFPAAILLSVAGANDRDQTHLPNHKPFMVLADYLSKRGIAVLRFDDRGVGGSEGNLMNANFTDLTHDALAAYSFLAERREINAKGIGYIGNSEGTVIAGMCAKENPEVAFTIMLGAVGVPLDQLSKDRLDLMNEMYQLNPSQKEEIIAYYQAVNSIIGNELSQEEKKEKLEALKAENTFDKLGFPNHLFFLPPGKEARIQLYLTPWYKAQATYDPQDVLPFLSCPALIINGSLDLFQSPELNFPPIREALNKAGNADFTLNIAPQINHVMQEAQTGLPTEYAKIEHAVAPVILQMIGDWLGKRF